MNPTLLRPNAALVERKQSSGVSNTGEPQNSPVTIYANIPCRIQPLKVDSRMGGDLELTVEGIVYIQTHVLLTDGLTVQQFFGAGPGDHVTVNGLDYIVDSNLLGAYFDIQQEDRISDEHGFQYLVLATAKFYDVNPNLQARLCKGRAW